MTASPFDVLPDAPVPAASGGPTPRRKNRWTAGLAIIFVLMVAALWVFLHLGSWLVIQDPLTPADVIVVLSGHMPYRAIEAARLYGQKAAPQVWVTQPIGPTEELAQMHIPFVGEDFYSQRVLMAQGVPALSIRILPDPSSNTASEIEEIAKIARQTDIHTVVIVTSAPHTRRVRTIWKRLVGDSPRLIVRHPLDDPFNGPRWWRSTEDALDVVREWLGLANAWAGFPAKPGQN
jgi:uncharacterized SAM-binding protein YcdF (DUF218 family)